VRDRPPAYDPGMDADFPTDLIPPKDAARLLGYDLRTVYRYVGRGQLRAWKLPGGRVRVSRADVLALLAPVRAERPAPAVAHTAAHHEAVRRLREAGLM
jgi:excisionase family DNA binding protein